jgi:hypothetical protein
VSIDGSRLLSGTRPLSLTKINEVLVVLLSTVHQIFTIRYAYKIIRHYIRALCTPIRAQLHCLWNPRILRPEGAVLSAQSSPRAAGMAYCTHRVVIGIRVALTVIQASAGGLAPFLVFTAFCGWANACLRPLFAGVLALMVVDSNFTCFGRRPEPRRGRGAASVPLGPTTGLPLAACRGLSMDVHLLTNYSLITFAGARRQQHGWRAR